MFDVAVDVRRCSPTFGQSVGMLLEDVAHHQIGVQPGFDQGFLVLSEMADFCCLCSEYYHPRMSRELPGTIHLWELTGRHCSMVLRFS